MPEDTKDTKNRGYSRDTMQNGHRCKCYANFCFQEVVSSNFWLHWESFGVAWLWLDNPYILWRCHCNVIGLLCNKNDVVAYTILLTAQLQVCFCLNVFQTELHYIWLQFISTASMPMGMAYSYSIYDLIGQHYFMHMYMLQIICWWWKTLNAYHTPFFVQMKHLSPEALTLCTSGIYDVF